MKNKILLILLLLFFVLINTQYFWEGYTGSALMFIVLLLVIIFFILVGCLLYLLMRSLREKFSIRRRNITVGMLAVVLTLTIFFPKGFIDFERWEGRNVLVAEREGAANCSTTIKLKEDNKFSIKSICFGIEKESGNYKVSADTIYFNYTHYTKSDKLYAFGVLKKDGNTITPHPVIELFTSGSDTLPTFLFIEKNELIFP